MTRRTKCLDVINEDQDNWLCSGKLLSDGLIEFSSEQHHTDSFIKCPYGQPGDVLWVRESFTDWKDIILHKAQIFNTSNWFDLDGKRIPYETLSWKPSIHMPFDVCRIFLRVKEIRVERLQHISKDEASKEGIFSWLLFVRKYEFRKYHESLQSSNSPSAEYEVRLFSRMWDSINEFNSWNSNPWVWVISFERITDQSEIAAIRKQWNERRQK